MQEYEFVYLASEYINRGWGILQFWVSVTFGLLAMSQLAVRHLNVGLLVIITFLYVDFSLLTARLLKFNGTVVRGYIGELQNLPSRTAGTEAFINNAPDSFAIALSFSSVFYGLFFGAVIFCWYSYFRWKQGAVNAHAKE